LIPRNADGQSRAARAKGGTGRNRLDEFAASLSEKQVAVRRSIRDRLLDLHNERSRRARIADRAKQAKTVTDPRKWARKPAKYDFPGIDTKDD